MLAESSEALAKQSIETHFQKGLFKAFFYRDYIFMAMARA
jgi:hypothetical protein